MESDGWWTLLFQSERQSIYTNYCNKLMCDSLIYEEWNAYFFDINRYIELYWNIITINDLIIWKISFDLSLLTAEWKTSFCIKKSMGWFLYNFASAVDDIDLWLNTIIRGQDKLPSLQFQEMIRRSLWVSSIEYIHLPMLLDWKIFYRDLIKQWITKHAILSYLLSSLYGNSDQIYWSIDEFVKSLDIKKIHKNTAKFDKEKLVSINTKILHQLSPEEYISVLNNYLLVQNIQDLLNILEIDEKLKCLIIQLRLNLPEAADLIRLIMNPIHDINIVEPILDVVKQTINVLEIDNIGSKNLQDIFIWLKNFNKWDIYKGIRWIMIGKIHWPDVWVLWEYFSKTWLISERVKKLK